MKSDSANYNQKDTTISDIHKTRERIFDECGGDIHAISQYFQKKQAESGRHTVSYAKSRVDSTEFKLENADETSDR